MQQMTRNGAGQPATPEKRGGFSFKGLLAKMSNTQGGQKLTQLRLGQGQDQSSAQRDDVQPEIAAHIEGKADFSSSRAPQAEVETPAATAMNQSKRKVASNGKSGAVEDTNNAAPKAEAKIRVYKGATYVKGDDNQWHLQQPQPSETKAEAQNKQRHSKSHSR
jgi:hypothetical protein